MINVQAPSRTRDAWMKSDGLEVLGSKFDSAESTMAKRLFLGKIAESDPQEAVQIVVGLAGGMKGEAKIIEVPAYVCNTKAKKEVVVTTAEAMKVIIENGGEFLSETTKEVKL